MKQFKEERFVKKRLKETALVRINKATESYLQTKRTAMEKILDILTAFYKYKKVYEKRCQVIMKQYDLRLADIEILYYVSQAGSKNMAKDIVDLGMSKANVSKSVDHIREKGYVTLYEDKEDRRCVHIEVTEAAEPILREVRQIRKEMGKALTEGIPRENIDTMKRVMQQMQQNLSRELTEAEQH